MNETTGGAAAFRLGLPRSACPYPYLEGRGLEWLAQWDREATLERLSIVIREEVVRQYRENERAACPGGAAFYEETVSPYLIAQRVLDDSYTMQKRSRWVMLTDSYVLGLAQGCGWLTVAWIGLSLWRWLS